MKITDLIPWRRKKREVPVRQDNASALGALQSDINRAFDDFWRGASLPVVGAGMPDRTPRVDVRENQEGIEVAADLPGLDEADVDVRVANGMLIIEAEKTVERKKEDKNIVLRERQFGKISRMVPLPDGLDLDSARANFKNGTLTVLIPWTPEAQAAVKRIPVHHE